jgi:hypothetical protein
VDDPFDPVPDEPLVPVAGDPPGCPLLPPALEFAEVSPATEFAAVWDERSVLAVAAGVAAGVLDPPRCAESAAAVALARAPLLTVVSAKYRPEVVCPTAADDAVAGAGDADAGADDADAGAGDVPVAPPSTSTGALNMTAHVRTSILPVPPSLWRRWNSRTASRVRGP